MVLCDELNKDAQAWADRGVFEHCKERNGAGENIGKFFLFKFLTRQLHLDSISMELWEIS